MLQQAGEEGDGDDGVYSDANHGCDNTDDTGIDYDDAEFLLLKETLTPSGQPKNSYKLAQLLYVLFISKDN